MDTIIEAQRRIEKSGINVAFDPSHPISPDLFCGRQEQTKQIINGIISLKQHVVLYGDRGVGKSSLAQYCGSFFAKNFNKQVYDLKCSEGDTFTSVVARIFSKLGIIIEKTETTERGMSIAHVIGVSDSKKTQTTKKIDLNIASNVAEVLKSKEGIFIIDEFDTLADDKEKGKFAQLMKLLSDNNTNIHLFIVGISLDVKSLLGGHNSVPRSLTQVFIPKMTNQELHDIIKKGEDRTRLIFKDEVKDRIVDMSLGYPYFTHLLAHESAKNAILDEREKITLKDLDVGIKEAIKHIDETLKIQYKNSLGVNEPKIKKRLLYCAAIIGNQGPFTMTVWILKYKDVYGEDIKNVTINSQMQKVINQGSCLLKSIRKGEYVFTNSLMPSYINILGKPD